MRKNLCVKIATFLFVLHSGAAHSDSDQIRTAFGRALESPNDAAAVKALLDLLPTVSYSVSGVPRTYYLFEGDLLQTREEIQSALRSKSAAPLGAGVPFGELLVGVVNGQPAIWRKGERHLTYAIDRASFPTTSNYNEVVRNMETATKAWEDSCSSCGLVFEHRPELDTGTSVSNVTFVIQFKPDETSFIAASFFPNDPQYRHQLFVAPSYFTTQFDHVGVLRHEIGHILGYRHEHIRGVAGCASEDGEWKPLTPYDPHSVMHYLCGGGGTFKLDLTESDKNGHKLEYSQ